ncbi:FH protein interacting protein FIP2-like [Malus sylvestris]|uniref:FH protein interacting protein FIP2-like n=1 Tax=Malus sylvestris TaxID=3752 RepID=UPI0021ABAC07|nr:FH protein interacting protein FIP2-like [Malus sylvestris]
MSTEENPNTSSVVRLDVGGKIFRTTIGTFTNCEPHSRLAAMFSGRHNLQQDENGAVFIDRDGKQFRHILNWLRDGKVPTLLEDSVYEELLREAEYYPLVGLMDGVQDVLNKNKGEVGKPCPDLTRAGVIDKYLKNLQGLDLSGLDLSCLDLSDLAGASFVGAGLQGANLRGASLIGCSFEEAYRKGAGFYHEDMPTVNLKGAIEVDSIIVT